MWPVDFAVRVSAADAIRTRSFWLLRVVLFGTVTAGIGILEQASPMIQGFFRDGGRSSVSVGAAAGFVGLLSLFNMAGRFAGSLSDAIGRPVADPYRARHCPMIAGAVRGPGRRSAWPGPRVA